ncbi:MAG: MMPL family transporter [Deltaproteobacteria bacterium]|nr:MMPL family transporter [Deltaproteobacteria bacterium]
MNKFLFAMTVYFETVPDRMRKKRWLVWIVFIALTVFAGFGLQRTEFDMTLEGWFSDSDPIKVALDEFHAEFGSDDGVFIVYKPADGNVFSAASLKAVQGIREELLSFRMRLKEGETSALKHIVRINTLVNASVLTVEDDSLVSRQLVGKRIPQSQQEVEQIRTTANAQKNFPLLYFSKDEQYGGIFIETDFGTVPLDSEESSAEEGEEDEFGEEMEEDEAVIADGSVVVERPRFKSTDMNEYLDLMDAINEVLHKQEYAGHLTYYPIGNAPMMAYGMEIMNEMGPMYMSMILIMMVLLWLLFRSLSAVVWPISIVVLSTVWVVGFTGWLGITITTFLMLTVMLILAVGTADAVHIISGYLFARNNGDSHGLALHFAYKKSALACLLATLTTMMGMLSLTFTPIMHIRVWGFMSAVGVVLALVFTIYLLPLMLDLWSPTTEKVNSLTEPKNKTNRLLQVLLLITAPFRWLGRMVGRLIPDLSFYLQKLLDQIIPIVEKSPAAFAGLFLAIFGVCLYGATLVVVDSNLIEQFKEGTLIRKTYEIVDRNMMGSQNMEVFVDMGRENAFQDPAVLKTMDRLQETLATKYSHLVVRTSSLADVVKDSYKTLNEGRKEMYIIPKEPTMLAQTLFLFNNANPEDRRKLVSDDYRKSHITVQLYNSGSYEYTRVFDRMQGDIDQAFIGLKTDYPEMDISITGGLALMMELSDYITLSQAKSLGLAIVVISIILIFVFGSYRAGLISIIPNLIPATLTFGLLGLFSIPLDADTMVIAPVIIGVAVDDTIHFITHYRGEVLLDGDITRALKETIKEVGQAITFTSLILGLGFSVMAFSNHMGTSNMGRFGTLAIFVALLCDLFLLPAMILIFKPRFIPKNATTPVNQLVN